MRPLHQAIVTCGLIAAMNGCATSPDRVAGRSTTDDSQVVEVTLQSALRFSEADEYSRVRVVDVHKIPHRVVRVDSHARLLLDSGRQTPWYGPGFTLQALDGQVRIRDRESGMSVPRSEVAGVLLRGPVHRPDNTPLVMCAGVGLGIGLLVGLITAIPGPR